LPSTTLFPYTTLFRSHLVADVEDKDAGMIATSPHDILILHQPVLENLLRRHDSRLALGRLAGERPGADAFDAHGQTDLVGGVERSKSTRLNSSHRTIS